MATQALPTSRVFLTSLLNSIAAVPISVSLSSSNTLRDAPLPIRTLLLTLHVLFPNEFLPALDVLERRLVVRFRLRDTEGGKENYSDSNAAAPPKQGHYTGMYFVRSAQQAPSHGRFVNALATHYEVRPRAWNCSCPAFAFSAFPAARLEASATPTTVQTASVGADWEFGGLCRAEEVLPVCKHLLACVLAERCPALFGTCVEEQLLSREELAGWCAGWGG